MMLNKLESTKVKTYENYPFRFFLLYLLFAKIVVFLEGACFFFEILAGGINIINCLIKFYIIIPHDAAFLVVSLNSNCFLIPGRLKLVRILFPSKLKNYVKTHYLQIFFNFQK